MVQCGMLSDVYFLAIFSVRDMVPMFINKCLSSIEPIRGALLREILSLGHGLDKPCRILTTSGSKINCLLSSVDDFQYFARTSHGFQSDPEKS